MEKTLLGFMANGVVVIHAGWVAFLVAGFVLVQKSPRGIRVHVGGLLGTFFLDVTGIPCPLTLAETALRMQGDPATAYEGSCITHYLGSVASGMPWDAVRLGVEMLLVLCALAWYGRLAHSQHLDGATRGA